MLSVITVLLATYALCYLGVTVVQLARQQRRPTPAQSAISPSMQQKMARSLTTLLTSGGIRELAHVKKMAREFVLTRQHFEAVAVPPEEDFAREHLIRLFR